MRARVDRAAWRHQELLTMAVSDPHAGKDRQRRRFLRTRLSTWERLSAAMLVPWIENKVLSTDVVPGAASSLTRHGCATP